MTLKEASESTPTELAKYIHAISQSRLLSHTKDACEKYVHFFEKQNYNETLKDLEIALKETNDSDKEKEIVRQIDSVKEEFKVHSLHISVNYSKKNRTARTVKKNNGFYVVIPTPNFQDKNSVRLSRELIAHELGHIVLHGKELSRDARGSVLIKTEKNEKEANLFSKAIIEHKKEYYGRICREKIFHS